MKSKRNWIIVIAVVALIATFAAFKSNSTKAPVYTTAAVTRGTIRSLVEATGTINAVTTVQVGSQVSGTISRLNANFNSQVKKGQVIAQIDPSIFEGNLLQARADLENARANAAAARANLEKAKSAAVQAKADYGRTQALAKEGVFSQQQLEVAKAAAESADASVNAAAAQVTQANAQVSQRSAAVAVSKTNLDHTTISAPVDGIVVNRSVDVGQTVAASLSAPTLFTIAQDLTKMLVYTKTDESDVGRIRSGQPVQFKVDAFPNETFRGRVLEVRMNATVVQNVVTYDTVIEFDNPERKLFPGMTAYVTIPVDTARDVLKVPNAALRFKPNLTTQEVRALYEKYNIQMGRPGGERESADAGAEGGADEGAAAESGGAPARQRGERVAAGDGEAAPAAQPGSIGGRGARRGMGGGEPNGEAGAAPAGQRGGGQRQGSGGGQAGGARVRPEQTAIVWALNEDKSLRPIKVRVGITDLTTTEVIEGELKEGDQLVTGSSTARSGPNPLGQAPGGGRRR
ncbi:MAG: efflux RND transporter periplasmic adaptor subunit [Terriglobales bacterium]